MAYIHYNYIIKRLKNKVKYDKMSKKYRIKEGIIMQGKDIILFDLDGTITDSKKGIFASIRYALNYFGIKDSPEEKLQKFLGPPLVQAFMEYYGMSEDANIALVKYREFYSVEGVFMLSMYKGFDDVIKTLKENGFTTALATSKPLFYAEKIVERIGIKPYFDYLCGATMDETMNEKADIIKYTIEKNNYDKNRILMVGDRNHDIKGAISNNVTPLGVLYGYGSKDELEKAGCRIYAETMDDLKRILIKK